VRFAAACANFSPHDALEGQAHICWRLIHAASDARGAALNPRNHTVTVAIVTAALAVPASASAATERVSVSSDERQANGVSLTPAVSADGRFAVFVSGAANLVAGDKNGGEVFVRDRVNGTTERVAVDAAGNQANRASSNPAITADGRFVAFQSIAANLVPGDTNGREDVFVKDRLTGAVDRVSVTSSGKQALADSGQPAISDDGRLVAFESSASLVPDDTNRSGDAGSDGDVFVHDRLKGTTVRVSVDSAGHEVADGSYAPSISGDGRFVGFGARVPGLVAGDTNGVSDAFVHDMSTGSTERVSVDSTGRQGSGGSAPPHISDGGRWVVFTSSAPDLVPGDANHAPDVFLRDRESGRTTRVSVDAAGTEAAGSSVQPTISRDGRVVAFASDASNLVGGDVNGVADAFIRELASGRVRRVSIDRLGAGGNGSSGGFDGSGGVALSADGTFSAFGSEATNFGWDAERDGWEDGVLVALGADTNGMRDIFVRAEVFEPFGLTVPKVTGRAVVGAALSGTPGTWAGTPEIGFAYQ